MKNKPWLLAKFGLTLEIITQPDLHYNPNLNKSEMYNGGSFLVMKLNIIFLYESWSRFTVRIIQSFYLQLNLLVHLKLFQRHNASRSNWGQQRSRTEVNICRIKAALFQ